MPQGRQAVTKEATGPEPATGSRSAWVSLLSLDLRSIALLRMGLGVIVWLDLAKRALTLERHYTDAGLLPRAVAETVFVVPWFAKFFYLGGSSGWVVFGFVLTALAALALVLGYRARMAAGLCWLLVLSINQRNPAVTHTGDAYLITLLLWAALLPSGARYGIDAYRRPQPRDESHFGPASAGLVVQLALFYMMAGVLKLQHEVWRDGQALQVFLGVQSYMRPFASVLQQAPAWLLRVGTYSTLALEIGAPLLLLWGARNGRGRFAFIGCLGGFHLLLFSAAHIGLFQPLCLIALFALLPPQFWQSSQGARLEHTLDRGSRRLAGGQAAPRMPATSRSPLMLRIASVVVGFFVLTSNWNNLGWAQIPVPRGLHRMGQSLALDQRWSMFTDVAHVDEGWFMVIGEQMDGTRYDLLDGSIVRAPRIKPRPANYAAGFLNHNERKYWGNISRPAFKPLRPALAQYYCEHWRQPLRHVGIFLVHQDVRADYSRAAPRARTLILHRCRR